MGPWSKDRPRVLNSARPQRAAPREGEILPAVRPQQAPQPLPGSGGGGHDDHDHAFTKAERLAHDLGAHKMGRATEREKLSVFVAGMGVGAFVVIFCAWVILAIFGESLKEAMSGGVVIGRTTTQWEQTKDDLAKKEQSQ